MREIILDTETTGLDPARGDRIVEIGCVELFNRIPTGEVFHVFINPERAMPADAFRIHGLSTEFLSDKPTFNTVAQKFLSFISDSRLVIHNAEFDMRFLNAELRRGDWGAIAMDRVTDTLALARRKHPGATASLDALCTRYRIDRSRRVRHGALLDAELLAEVYLELSGGRQSALLLHSRKAEKVEVVAAAPAFRSEPLAPRLTPEDAGVHRAFSETLGEKAVWLRYRKEKKPA